jgi:predicted alpha/beta superfamily hydrolase
MKHLLTTVVLLITVTCFSQPNNNITIGKIDTVRSKILNETRRIGVYIPASASNKMFTKQVYPVVYLLDASAHFHSVTGLIQQLSYVSGNTVLPEMIVVGIQNTDRTRDLTPTHSTSSAFGQTPEMLKTSGGADNFLAFIEKELMPYIDSTYPVAPYKMLVGHSFGGLFAIHTLLNKPHLFNSYVALDPSLWWDDQVLAKKAITALKQNTFPAKPFYLAIANVLNTKSDINKILKDTAETSIGIRTAFQLAKTLDKYKKTNQPWHWKYYPEDSHGSVPLIAQYDAFRTFFKGHQLTFPIDPTDIHVDLYKNHYQKVSALMGYKVHPPEMKVYLMGNRLMVLGMLDKAYEFLKLNIENYPASFMVYDNMGDYYIAKGEKEKAIEHFKKALTLKDTPETRKKLEKLTSTK